jgi:hypothetical protein
MSIALKATASFLVMAAGAGIQTSARAASPEPARNAESSGVRVSVQGWGRLYYPAPDEIIQFTVDAHAKNLEDGSPGAAWGTARISHRRGPVDSWAKVAVDCVATGGPVATITGIVIDASPDNQQWRDTRLGFSVYDGGDSDRVGFTGPRQPGDPPLRRCVAIAPTFTVTHGGFTVKRLTSLIRPASAFGWQGHGRLK